MLRSITLKALCLLVVLAGIGWTSLTVLEQYILDHGDNGMQKRLQAEALRRLDPKSAAHMKLLSYAGPYPGCEGKQRNTCAVFTVQGETMTVASSNAVELATALRSESQKPGSNLTGASFLIIPLVPRDGYSGDATPYAIANYFFSGAAVSSTAQ